MTSFNYSFMIFNNLKCPMHFQVLKKYPFFLTIYFYN